MAKLESERRWINQFEASQEQLAALADEALRELKEGVTRPMDIDRDFPFLKD